MKKKNKDRNKKGQFKRKNTAASGSRSNSAGSIMATFMREKRKPLLNLLWKKAKKEGDMQALSLLFNKAYGKLPQNTLDLRGDESSEELLSILKSSNVPLEVITVFNRLLESNIKTHDIKELSKEIEALKNSKTKSGGWKK